MRGIEEVVGDRWWWFVVMFDNDQQKRVHHMCESRDLALHKFWVLLYILCTYQKNITYNVD